MTAHILVVDDVPANVKLLEARLRAEYYDVSTAFNGADALALCAGGNVDLVLLDVMMPGIDGFEVCRRLKANPATAQIPVVIITALDGMDDRIEGLRAGADDFLTKPANDLQLITRVKNLVRFKALTDEMRLRACTANAFGAAEKPAAASQPAKVLLVEDRGNAAERIATVIGDTVKLGMTTSDQCLVRAFAAEYDCILISSNTEIDPLALSARLKASEKTRNVPILLIADPDQEECVVSALDMGVNDYINRPVNKQELLARLATQVARKRYGDQLRQSVTRVRDMPVIDSLTGMHSRRYLDTHLDTLVARAGARGRPLSLMLLDLDRFGQINDTFGHDMGDQVLSEVGKQLRGGVRGLDLACRFDGDAFAIVMPETDLETAHMVADRIRAKLGSRPVEASGTLLPVFASVGVATLGEGEDGHGLVRDVEAALVEAKSLGRNQVVVFGGPVDQAGGVALAG